LRFPDSITVMMSQPNKALLQFAAARWVIAIGVFIAWTAVLLLVKRVLLRTAARCFTGHPKLQQIEALLAALSPAISIVIVASGAAIGAQVWQMPPHWQADIDILVMGGMIAALVVFADRMTHLWLRSGAARYPLFNESYGIVTGAIRGLIIALGVLMFLQSAGVSIGPILASLGIGSLAIALGLQETVKNMFSGLFVIADKPLVVGDFVKLETGQQGQLIKLGWRSSKFMMLNEGTVVVPNSKLVDSILTNYRASDGEIALTVDLAVLASNDLARVEHVTQEVADEVMRTVDGAVPEFKCSIRFSEQVGSATSLSVIMRAKSAEVISEVRHELVKRVLARYQREEIKTPST
jgi:small-conductance mechanosensitive channel